MKSNWTLLPAALLVAVLALAGCGGGSSSDDTMPPPPPPPTPEEECEDAGNNWHDGACYTDQELIDLGIEQGRDLEAEERDAEEAAEAREAMAKKLRGLLAVAAVNATNVAPTNTATASSHLNDEATPPSGALLEARGADNGEGMEEKAHVMVYNNKGPKTKASGNATNVAFADIDASLVMGAGFATGTAEVKEHDDGSTVRGTYNGATGGYVCNGTDGDCTSQRTKDGILLRGTTGWTFEPDAGQKFDVADANYAEWGWWIDEGIADGDAANPNDKVGAWYLVTTPTGSEVALSATDTVTGTATYRGEAAGKAAYYHRQSDSNIGGAFTADAVLTADFDAGTAGRLSGSITGFDVGGMNPAWSVELMRQDLAGVGIAASGANMTKWTIDGTEGDAAGTWTATFYGIPSDEHQPSGVAGGFQTQYESDGYMVGAFGAER